MRGPNGSRRLGRIAAPAALVTSAAMFATALSGIASIDPGAGSAGASAAPAPAAHGVSLDRRTERAAHRRDCPYRHRDGARRDFTS